MKKPMLVLLSLLLTVSISTTVEAKIPGRGNSNTGTSSGSGSGSEGGVSSGNSGGGTSTGSGSGESGIGSGNSGGTVTGNQGGTPPGGTGESGNSGGDTAPGGNVGGNNGNEGGNNNSVGGGEGDGEGEGGGGGGGGGTVGEGFLLLEDGTKVELGDIIVNVTCDCPKLKPYETYVPKIGYLKSANAALVDYFNESVYFVPSLADFPVDLSTTVTNLVDSYGEKHKYALIYNGYFDNDVAYVSASPLIVDDEGNEIAGLDQDTMDQASSPKIATSKKVYSAEDNSRLLNMVGYDLLLSKEDIPLWQDEEEGLMMDYKVTKVGTGEMRAETLVMDLYKVMGVYEWMISVGYSTDEEFNINESPLLEKISFMTSADVISGVDASECEIWVSATRTDPDLYWKRCIQDAIFDGGLHNVTNEAGTFVGSETSVSATYSRDDKMTLGEFCALARAIMTLYGEPVLTVSETEACMLAYGVILPQSSYTKEIYDSIVYLAAKGIVDPTQKNFSKNVTFKDIEDILLRIADPTARISVKRDTGSIFASMGFTSLDDITIASSESYVSITDVDDLQYLDYLIEHNLGTEFWVTRRLSAAPVSSGDGTVDLLANTSNKVSEDEIFGRDREVLSTENLVLDVGGVPLRPEDGVWKFVGIENYNGHSFYHIKINPNAKNDEGSIFAGKSIALSYDAAENERLIRGHAIPIVLGGGNKVPKSIAGGIYMYTVKSIDDPIDPKFRGEHPNYDDQAWFWDPYVTTFDDAGFDLTFRDASRYKLWHNEFLELTSAFNMEPWQAEGNEDVEYINQLRENIGGSSTNVFNGAVFLDAHSIVAIDVNIPLNGLANYWNVAQQPEPNFRFDNCFSNNGTELVTNKRIEISNDVTAYIIINEEGNQSNPTKRARFEFYCNDTGPLLSTHFIQCLISSNPNNSYVDGYQNDATDAYYRAEDNVIMVSVKYLQDKGLVETASYAGHDTLVIRTTYGGTNIILEKGERPFAMIGDCLYPFETGTVLFEEANGDYYIDYRACVGWGQTFLLIPTGDPASAILIDAELYNNPNLPNGSTEFYNPNGVTFYSKIDMSSVTNLPGQKRIEVPIMVTKDAEDLRNKTYGLMLTGSYALAPYIVVCNPDTNSSSIDYLFVYHIRGFGDTEDLEDDEEARGLFEELTGHTLMYSDTYFVVAYPLDKNELTASELGLRGYCQEGGAESLKYLTQTLKGKFIGTRTVTYGWCYVPVNYSDITKALQEYADCKKASDDDTLPISPLPIFYYNVAQHPGYYDANVNACSAGYGEPFEDVGILPGVFWGERTKYFGRFTVSLAYQQYGDKNTDNVRITPAPAGAFSQFKGGVSCVLQDIEGAPAVYWGTTPLYKSNNQYVAGSGLTLGVDMTDTAVCAYVGESTSKSVYVVNANIAGLVFDVNDIIDSIEMAFYEAQDSVDWDEFTFNRLITKLDLGMSIVLVFVLNILPRVCILLFFVLMMLALIKDFSLWKRFCETKFDVYKALTFGRVSVLTIDLKKLVISSMLSISIFMIIMDGTFIQLITFIARFILTLAQH